eukprot:1136791-Pelagomonas_calceolata.AAC.7
MHGQPKRSGCMAPQAKALNSNRAQLPLFGGGGHVLEHPTPRTRYQEDTIDPDLARYLSISPAPGKGADLELPVDALSHVFLLRLRMGIDQAVGPVTTASFEDAHRF